MSKQEVKARRKSNRQMLDLIRKHMNNPRLAATEMVEEFMRIPADKRSDEILIKIDKEIERYRLKAHSLLVKDKKRKFRHAAHELDDTFGEIDSHPSLFGTQPEQDSDEESRDSSEESDSESASEESDMETEDDIDNLSQRLSQLAPAKASKKTQTRKPRGENKTYDKALNDPKIADSTRVARLERIRQNLEVISTRNGVSLVVLIAMVLKNETYIHDRHLARVADWILNPDNLDPNMTIQEAIYIREECLLSQGCN